MNHVTVVLSCVLLAGCASNGSFGPPPTDTKDFRLISEKRTPEVCAAGFEREGLVFLVIRRLSQSDKWGSATVYDPHSRLYATVALPTGPNYRECGDVQLSYSMPTSSSSGTRIPPPQRIHLFYASGEPFRSLLDGYPTHPENINNIHRIFLDNPRDRLTYGAKDRWFIRDGFFDASTIGDIASFFKTLRLDEAQSIVKKEEATRAQYQKIVDESQATYSAELAAEWKERARLEEISKRLWNQRMSYPIAIGDRVCSYGNNSIGEVEEISKDRVKVHVFGRAIGNVPPGVWFNDTWHRTITTDHLEAPRWFERKDVAKCTWDIAR